MKYEISKDVRKYLKCSDEQYIELNLKLERAYIELEKGSFSRFGSVYPEELSLWFGTLNFQRFFSDRKLFSNNAINDIILENRETFIKFIETEKVSDIGDKDYDSYFYNLKPFGKNNLYYLVISYFIYASMLLEGSDRYYWEGDSNRFGRERGEDNFMLIVESIASYFTDDFFSDMLDSIPKNINDDIYRRSCFGSGLYENISKGLTAIKSSLNGSDKFTFDRYENLSVLLGEKIYKYYKDEVTDIVGKSLSDWSHREIYSYLYEYISSDNCDMELSKGVRERMRESFLKQSYRNNKYILYYYYCMLIEKISKGSIDSMIKDIKSLDLDERSGVYCAYISKGYGNKKFFRKMRSESSGKVSLRALNFLIKRRFLFGSDYLQYVSQFNDTRVSDVAEFLVSHSPKENLTGLLGNPFTSKDKIFKRLNEK